MQIQKHVIHYGLRKLLIGVPVTVPVGKDKKGKTIVANVNVKDATQFPDAKFVVRCLTCKEDFEDEKALKAGHPGHKEMVESESVHVWAFYSEDLVEELEVAPDGANKEQRKAVEEANAKIGKIGLASDVPWI
jgi:hypothetical protein